MRKTDIPQDDSALKDFTQEVCYVKDDTGKYDTALSSGWSVKATALENAWSDVNESIENARSLVESGKKSPIYFHMHKHMMNVSLLSSYTNISFIRVWLHMNPFVFKRIKPVTLNRYAKVFKVEVVDLCKLK